jgi:hypothetical protein
MTIVPSALKHSAAAPGAAVRRIGIRVIVAPDQRAQSDGSADVASRCAIGVDFGTESGRAVLVDVGDDRELASVEYRYENGEPRIWVRDA